MIPFWKSVNQLFVKQRTITTTLSYSRMKTKQIQNRRRRNKEARKARRINRLRSL